MSAIEIADDTPIRDFIENNRYGDPDTDEVLSLVEAIINIDERVLGTDEYGSAILGIEREEIIATLLLEMKNGS